MPRHSEHIWVVDAFLDGDQCRRLLQGVGQFRKANPLPQIFRPAKERSLRYYVINGRQVAASFPQLLPLYSEIRKLAQMKSGLDLQPMRDELVGININITPPGGEYRWHYDRNAVTAILFLNEVTGGETEIYPGYRIRLKNRSHTRMQRRLDSLLLAPWLRRWLGSKTTVRPQAGKMLLMRGDACLHSVRRVEGCEDRINILFSYEQTGARPPRKSSLNDYLYTDQDAPSQDPNYLP